MISGKRGAPGRLRELYGQVHGTQLGVGMYVSTHPAPLGMDEGVTTSPAPTVVAAPEPADDVWVISARHPARSALMFAGILTLGAAAAWASYRVTQKLRRAA